MAEQHPPAFNISEVEAGIEAALRNDPPRLNYPIIRQTVPPPLQTYAPKPVDPVKVTTDVLAAHSEEAVKALEMLGKALVDAQKDVEQVSAESLQTLTEIKELCDRARDQSKAITERVAQVATLNVEVRKICEELRSRIGA